MIVVYAYPEDEFYPAVILRTLYAALGLRDVAMYIIPRKRIRVDYVARYGRVPVELLKERVAIIQDPHRVLELLKKSSLKILLLTSDIGLNVQSCSASLVEKLEMESTAIVIDELGILARAIAEDRELLKRVLCSISKSRYGKLAYDAIGVLYHVCIKKIAHKIEIPEQELGDLSLSELFYLMKHVLDSCKIIDNFLVVSPRALVYTLRHMFLNRGIFLDLVETKLMFDHVRGECVEEIVVDVYRSRTLEYLGRYTCTLRGRMLEVPYIREDGSIKYLKLYIDYEHGKVYFNSKICYERPSSEREQEIIQELGRLFT